MMSLLRPALSAQIRYLRRSRFFPPHSGAHISESGGQKTPEFRRSFYGNAFPDGLAFVTLPKYRDIDDVIAKRNSIPGRTHAKKIEALGRIMVETLGISEMSLQPIVARSNGGSFYQTGILRHKAENLNLSIRSDGFVEVNELLKLREKTRVGLPLCSHSINDVKEAVKVDSKQRFTLREEDGKLLIRANQGHSIEVIDTEKLLKPVTSAEEVPVCIHGSYTRNFESILQNGLMRMNRLHFHFSSGLPCNGGVISGLRSNCEILIHLDVDKAMKDGMKFYISDNDVLLTEGFVGVIPRKYFAKIETWPARDLIYPE